MRRLSTALLAMAVAASTTACGVSGITTLADSVTPRTLTLPPPLEGKSADQIATMSLKNLGNAASVRLIGTFDDSGTRGRMNVRLVKGVGCSGTIQEQGQGSFQLIVRGKVAWMDADTAFWTAQGVTGSALNTVSGKYIKITKSSEVSQFDTLCGAASSIANLSSSAVGLTQIEKTMNGRPVVELKDTADSATMVVSNTTTPEILQVNDPGSGGGSFLFSDFNQAARITPPPAGQTLDGAQFGL